MILVFDAVEQIVRAVHGSADLGAAVDRYPDYFPIEVADNVKINLDYEGDGIPLPQLSETQGPDFGTVTRLKWVEKAGRWELDQAGREYWSSRYTRRGRSKTHFEAIMSSQAVRSITNRADARAFAEQATQGSTNAEIVSEIRNLLGDALWLGINIGRYVDESNDMVHPPMD